MGELKVIPSRELDFNFEFYVIPERCKDVKVGCVNIISRSAGVNQKVSQSLKTWLTENGWIDLVRVEEEVVPEYSTTLGGFSEATVKFVPGEFQSNELRVFHAEIPNDLNDLREELELWLTEVNSAASGTAFKHVPA